MKSFKVIRYSKQIVAGVNYKIHIRTDDDDEMMEVIIFEDLPCNGGGTKLV
eukprot:CAMPEP_0119569500 /NCGR_PEP_ID=MMETSP1352-20130426/41801_1 /TAXON_ID=265584 /ORGANISM="Stauroneis constricta, Strain CCMP1120" /LENGTH=50 /DNA_ID=CAMNT_0007619055 /DNA_START=39 /DNA_END=188 /DNA_ORIENTATION=+